MEIFAPDAPPTAYRLLPSRVVRLHELHELPILLFDLRGEEVVVGVDDGDRFLVLARLSGGHHVRPFRIELQLLAVLTHLPGIGPELIAARAVERADVRLLRRVVADRS